MTTHFLRSYSKLLIRICHRRNIHAMGGMAAFIPVKNDPVANEKAIAQVCADKEREAGDGNDGTWVAHPGLVGVAAEIFDRLMPGPNQIEKKLSDFQATAADLLEVPKGQITEAGLRQNIAVGLGYLEAWLRGIGCVPLFNLMEDAATAEISRAQIWQWIHQNAHLQDGRKIDVALCDRIIDEELAKAKQAGDAARYAAYEKSAQLMRDLIRSLQFVEFLTVPAYQKILSEGN
jgi:malate synthase